MKLQTSMQSILVSIFRVGLLRLSAGTYEASSSIAASVCQSFGTILTYVHSVW